MMATLFPSHHCVHNVLHKVLHQCIPGRQFSTSTHWWKAVLHQQMDLRCTQNILNVSISGNILSTASNSSFSKSLMLRKERCTHLYKKTLFSDNFTDPSLITIRHNLIGKEPIAAKFMKDIDLDQMREELKVEKEKSDKNSCLMRNKIRDHVQKKSDEAMASLSEADSKALKLIKLEHDFLYSQGYNIPSAEEMRSEHWLEALQFQSYHQRLKFYFYISNKIRLSKMPKPSYEKRGVRMDSYEHGRIFHRIYNTTMKRACDYKLASAMVHGPPLVFDFDFEQHMKPKELKNTGSQILNSYILNRQHKSPFHLHFANCPPTNLIFKTYQMLRLNEYSLDLATVTEKSYLDLFDKERLVYLSPHAKSSIHEFNPDDVYIIGAFNDSGNQRPLSYARAKHQGIRCAKLPLDDYVDWGIGRKTLCLNTMTEIMLTFYETQSWKQAFKHLPSRVLKSKDHLPNRRARR